jgi:predicted nucleic acid-binding protein
MCVIIDTNVLTSVFITTSKDHSDFEPVYNWIFNGNGKVVWGGSKYFEELKKHGRYYVKVFATLQNQRKVYQVSADEVDKTEAKLINDFPDTKINDHHLAAIVINSKCHIVCTYDNGACSFLKDPSVYPRGINKPKIYKSIHNADLIDDRHIVKCCKPSEKLSKDDRETLKNALEKI